MGEQKSIWYKLGNLDYRIIYLLIGLLTAYPLWSPVGTPMTVGENVENYYNQIKAMEPGTVVICIMSGYMTMLPDVQPIYMATYKLLFSQPGIKVVLRVSDVDGQAVIKDQMAELDPETTFGVTYGEDYVIIPYVPWGSGTIFAYIEDIRNVYEEDYYGNSLDDLDTLPIMAYVKGGPTFDWIISSGAQSNNQYYTIPFGTKLLCWGTGTGLLPFVPPYYDPDSGPVYGYVGGASQGGELEKVSGFFGNGVKYNDTKNLALVGLILFIIVGNVSYFGEKYAGGGN